MKGLIVLPKFFETRHTYNYKVLLNMIADKFCWDIVYSDYPKIKGYDVLVLYSVPSFNRPYIMNYLCNTSKNIKVIGIMRDVQHYNNMNVKIAMDNMLDRYDAILIDNVKYFNDTYTGYSDKVFDFNINYSDKKYKDYYNKNPMNRCLLTGEVNEIAYPLRSFISKNFDKMTLDILPSPILNRRIMDKNSNDMLQKYSVMKHNITHDKYHNMVGKYFCCATDTSLFGRVLSKFFEIPTVGSLLMSNYIDEMKQLGFEPGVNFIEINKENAIDQINDCTNNPESYEQIRKAGKKFVTKEHTIDIRFNQLNNIINEVIN